MSHLKPIWSNLYAKCDISGGQACVDMTGYNWRKSVCLVHEEETSKTNFENSFIYRTRRLELPPDYYQDLASTPPRVQWISDFPFPTTDRLKNKTKLLNIARDWCQNNHIKILKISYYFYIILLSPLPFLLLPGEWCTTINHSHLNSGSPLP